MYQKEADPLSHLENKLCQIFGESHETVRFFAAPGRVNLIGEHIDYCGGAVLPAALTLGNTVAARRRNDSKVRLAATDLADCYEFDLNRLEDARGLTWGNYQAGVVRELLKMGISLGGADLLFQGAIPFGSGLSSSASIELVTAVAMTSLYQQSCDLIQLALAGQRAENNFCGVNCGIMDQFASAMGKKDHAILLDCATLSYQYIPLRLKDYLLVLANTCKKHSLGTSKYNERRQEVETGLRALQQALPGKQKEHLCDYTPEEYLAGKDSISSEVIRKRVEHVIYENQRVQQAVQVLQKGDLNAFGDLLRQAHQSIRFLYEVTGLELDTMFEEACQAAGCIGSRMTGGGFGGCTINIVQKDAVEAFCHNVGEGYQKKTGIVPQFYVCQIGDGARELFPNS